jgi:hypothetical protein
VFLKDTKKRLKEKQSLESNSGLARVFNIDLTDSGDFKDQRDFKSNPQWFLTCAKNVTSQLIKQGTAKEDIMFYVTTDAMSFKHLFLKEMEGYEVYIHNRTASHFQHTTSGIEFTNIVSEFYELALSDYFIISNSGFGQMPTAMAMKPAFEPPLECVFGKEQKDFSEWRHWL